MSELDQVEKWVREAAERLPRQLFPLYCEHWRGHFCEICSVGIIERTFLAPMQKAQADEREYRRKLEDELRDKDESLRQFMRATTKLQDEKAEVLLKRDAEWRALLDRALGPGHSAQSCDDETAIRRTVAERERVAREDEAKKWLGLIPMYGADAANLWAKQRLAELKSPKHPGTL